MKSNNDNQQHITNQPASQGSATMAAQKPRRRRIRTYDKILNDPFVLTC